MSRHFILRKNGIIQLMAMLVLLCAAVARTSAQAPAIQWQKAIGFNTGGEGNAICQTADGGFLVAGTVDTQDVDTKIKVIKLNAAGTELWQKNYGSPYPDEVQHIEQTADGGFLLSASVSINGGDVTAHHGQYDVWLMKADAAGQLQWQRCYGGSRQESWGYATQTPDGGYILCSGTKSADGDITGKQNGGSMDGLVMKLSPTGAVQWQKTYGGSSDDLFRTIVPAPGGYYACGWAGNADGIIPANNGSVDAWIVKLDLSGNIVWQRTYGGGFPDLAQSIATTPDGGCVAAGFTRSNSHDFPGNHGAQGVADGWVIRLNAAGGEEWKRVFGGSGTENFDCIRTTADGGFIVLGRSQTADGDVAVNLGGDDIWLLQLSAAGSILWQKSLGGSQQDGQPVWGKTEVVATMDGGVALASVTTSPGIPGIQNPGQNTNNWYVARLEAPCDTITAIHDSTVCANGLGVVMLGSKQQAQPPYTWSTGAVTEAIAVSDTGTYWRTSGSACHFRTDTFRLRHSIRYAHFIHDTTVCRDVKLQLEGDGNFLTYRWNNGDTLPFITTDRPGHFTRVATDACRSQTDSFIVRHTPALQAPELGAPIQACFDRAPLLGKGQPGARYRWSTGETTALIRPQYSGLYSLQISNGCEEATDSVQVTMYDCGACFAIPTAFSPNGDGRNDFFSPMVRCAAGGYRFEIFNRWGQCLFVASQTTQRWDGTFNGQAADPGTYFYSINALGPDGRAVRIAGEVMLVR